MPKNSLVYAILWLLIQLLVEVNCQTTSIRPQKRVQHTATLIGKRLYRLGGSASHSAVADDIIGKQFIYCDFNVTINVRGLLWQDVTSINTVPSHSAAASINGGKNNNTLFLYTGDPKATSPSIYAFDTQNNSNSWDIPTIFNDNGIRKAQ